MNSKENFKIFLFEEKTNKKETKLDFLKKHRNCTIFKYQEWIRWYTKDPIDKINVIGYY